MDSDSYKIDKPMSVNSPPPKPLDSLPRVYPRQVSTGYTRGVQTIGFGPDALDGPNNRIVLSGQSIFVDPLDNTKIAQFDMSSIATGTTSVIVLPNGGGSFITTTSTSTLTNKTLITPIIASISNTGLLTLPTSTDTLVGRATTDTLTNKTISFPAYTDFLPAPTGFTATPTTTVARALQQGKLVIMDVSITGTSNAVSVTFTLPAAAKSAASYPIIVTDSGTTQTSPGLLVFTAASATATCYKTLASGAFTNSGTKAFQGFGIVYEAN